MKPARGMPASLLIVVAVAAASSVAAWLWWTGAQPQPVRIAGAGAALPRAEAAAEFILPEALEAARAEAQRQDVRALLVHRRGHRVFEYFSAEHDGGALLDGGALAAAVFTLALHEPGQEAGADAAQAAALVSERLWRPLRAGDARLISAVAAGGRRCCIQARLDDWMRVGDLLLGQGAYLGERIVTADAVRALLAEHPPPVVQADEPLLARDGTGFDLAPGVRLWLAPRRNLAVLVWTDAQGARDTLLPNLILRGLADAAPAIEGAIGDLVPGH